MLKPKELQNLPKGLTDIYSELSEFVLRDIARPVTAPRKVLPRKFRAVIHIDLLGKSAPKNGISERQQRIGIRKGLP